MLEGCRYALVVFVDSALVFEPARALANEGDAQRLRGDLDAAAKLYDHAIEAGSRNELPWCGKGQVALEKGQFSEAAACYATAVDITPSHSVAWTNLGVALAKVGAPADVPVLKEAALTSVVSSRGGPKQRKKKPPTTKAWPAALLV